MIAEGSVIVAYLQDPREKIFGLLLQLSQAGIVIRGMDLNAFHDWKQQRARGEEAQVGPVTSFYPMHRIQRLELDETVGPIPSLSRSFMEEVGISAAEALRPNPSLEPL